ncbi:LysR family transcriptional regulator [Falsirhodobacter sp. 20TX0035]|uniref:LysR family transcriptional regulator n=1 Tax=Falsirhodobacter sp. 20TX0035 TaxID=3022019 RepID=UPI002330F7D7|nr:LysR family transcriptional regulator [Falsirhodobacter sp. 20TX0035]MDB6455107.1 LysR family transcriptional regulator [Falsirhodobacter sp. 20TX0035]
MSRIDHIDDLRAFEAVARMGSLSAAAREVGVALSVLSKRLARLEAAVGERLAERSTRALRLTPAGESFLGPCRDALTAFDVLEDRGDAPLRGRIRLSASVAFSQRRIAPCLPTFLNAHPGVTVELIATEQRVDLVREGVDLALRQGPVSEVGERLVGDAHLLVASPTYLAQHGTPKVPEDLDAHRCLTVGRPAPRIWALQDGTRQADARIHPVLTGTDGETAHAAALAGGGIAMKSVWDVMEDLVEGRLVHVLPGWHTGGREVRALLPSDRRPRLVRRLLKHLRDELAPLARHPLLEGG